MPFVTENMEADMLDCFETAKILLSTLGFPLFDSISQENNKTSEDIFKMKSKEAIAEGDLIDEGFVVYRTAIIMNNFETSKDKFINDFFLLLTDRKLL